MESTPKNIDVSECFNELINIDCIEEIHDFHVWSLSVGKLAMSGHIRSSDPDRALKMVSKLLRNKYEIFHTTLQVEKSANGAIMCCDNDAEDEEAPHSHGHEHGHSHGHDHHH
jgi:Co/Zn/Cd efflux system component